MRGTGHLIDKLNRISDAVTQDVPKIVDDQVRDRAMKAQTGYAAARYTGKNDVKVTAEHVGDEWTIRASGTVTLFIEFGTGIIYPHTNDIDSPMNAAGSWSVEHEQYLTDSEKLARYKGGWPLNNGVVAYGNPSANVMMETRKAIDATIPVMVKSALRKAIKS